jgi:hypothetical protein
MGQRPDEYLLGEILGTLGVSHLAVEEPHDGGIRALVQLLQLVAHDTSAAQ